MVYEFTQGTVYVEVGQTFEIPLTYPGGIYIKGNIIKSEDAAMTIRFGIEGEINALPLIWEQTVIYINGQESFILPGYKTNYITTKGYSGYYEEEEPETEHGPVIIIDDGEKTQEEVIIDDGGKTQEEIIIDDGGQTQEEIIIDDGGQTQEEIIIDDGGEGTSEIMSASFV